MRQTYTDDSKHATNYGHSVQRKQQIKTKKPQQYAKAYGGTLSDARSRVRGYIDTAKDVARGALNGAVLGGLNGRRMNREQISRPTNVERVYSQAGYARPRQDVRNDGGGFGSNYSARDRAYSKILRNEMSKNRKAGNANIKDEIQRKAVYQGDLGKVELDPTQGRGTRLNNDMRYHLNSRYYYTEPVVKKKKK